MSREWNGSQVMDEFAKIAAESGLITSDFGTPVVGNPDKETPVKDHRRYEPGEEYGITKETGEDLIGEAHPKDAKPAEAMGDGGLVENIVQQQKKDIEVATQMPNGALVGKHAALINTLIALANELEGEGKTDIAARVDRTIERISGLPFDNSFRKEAWAWPFMTALLAPLKAIFWGGAAAGTVGGAWYMFGAKLTSLRESLSKDIRDVVEIVLSVGKDPSLSKLATDLRTILTPYIIKFKRPIPSPGQEAELKEYLTDLDNFAVDLGKVTSSVAAMTAVPGEWYKFGLDAKSRLKEKLSDMVKTFGDVRGAVKGLAGMQPKVEEPVEAERGTIEKKTPLPEATRAEKPVGDDIAEIQKLLAEHGSKVSQNGKLDNATKGALRQLEKQLDTTLRRDPKLASILEQKGWTISGFLLRQDGTVADPETLRRLMALADRTSSKGL